MSHLSSHRAREPRFEVQEDTRADDEVTPSKGATSSAIHAVEYIRPMRGASQPHLLRGDDGSYYIVKFRNNPQHVRILANEMFGGRLARMIGLPVPEPAFIDVPPQLVSGTPELGFEIGIRREPCSAGLQFGSRFAGAPGQTLVVDFLPDRLLKRVANLGASFLDAFVFDKWTCNCDGRQMIFTRSAGQEGGAYSAWMIDHGFCFNDGEWNFPDSPIRSIYPRRSVYEAVRGLRSFEPFLSRIENLEARQVEECLRYIPSEWCGGAPDQLTRLAERLYERRRILRQAIIDTKNCSLCPFPNWR